MEREIGQLLQGFESGRLSRRELIGALTAMAAGSTVLAKAARQDAPMFQAVGLNHIALSVTDLARSRDFYVQHLGLRVTRDSASSCFLDCGEEFVALFRQSEQGLNHYCYAIQDFDVRECARKLEAAGIQPRISGNRIYFDDPDGSEVQLAARGHSA